MGDFAVGRESMPACLMRTMRESVWFPLLPLFDSPITNPHSDS